MQLFVVDTTGTENRYIPTDYLMNHPTTMTIKTDKTSTTSLTHRTAYVTKTDTLNMFFRKTTTTLTLLDETFTDLQKLTHRTGTQHLLLQ